MAKRVIYLAGGCFWGMQAYFDKARIAGVIESSVGYANSIVANPSYEMVCSGVTNAVECLELCYDDSVLSLDSILSHFLSIIDPCALNFQGNDIGTQYRNGVYYIDSANKAIIESCIVAWEKAHNLKAVTEVLPLLNYYKAESYHQNYLQKHPNGYCHIRID